MRFVPYIFLLGVLMPAACDFRQDCDVIIYNAQIHTMNPEQPFANAMAIDNGRIIAIGENEQILTGWNAEQTVNFHQAHVFPGFIDAHAHLYGLGEESRILSLIGTRSSAEVLAEVLARTKATPEGEWIRGRGWDQNDWKDRSFPNAAELDRVSPNHPIMLSRIDGHAVWVNSRALQIAGITHETADPDGGRILRLPDASPSGVLMDNAIELVRSHIPEPGPEDLRAAYLNAVQRCLALGLTGVHDMGLSANRIAAIRALIDSNAFPLRVVGYIDGRGEEWEALLRTGRTDYGDKRLVLAGLKLYADGALGSRGAWLMDDYSDDPGNRGIAIESYDVIRSEAKRAMKQRLQVCPCDWRRGCTHVTRCVRACSERGVPFRTAYAHRACTSHRRGRYYSFPTLGNRTVHAAYALYKRHVLGGSAPGCASHNPRVCLAVFDRRGLVDSRRQ